jgi:uncharacterized membrane protein
MVPLFIIGPVSPIFDEEPKNVSRENMRSKLPLLFLIAAATVFIASLLYFLPTLPDRIATQFGAAGQPNGWMSREQHIIGIALVGFAIPAFVIGICYCIRFFPSSMLNVPNASYWRSPEHYHDACRILLHWSFLFGATSFLWTTILNYQLVLANRLKPPFLAPAPVMMLSGFFMASTAVLIIVLMLRFLKIKKHPIS